MSTDDSGPSARRVVVVGAGIAGLTAARVLRASLPDAEVLVLEASDSVGGKLRLGEVGGVRVDLGAESMLARRPEAVALAREVGLEDRIVHPATTAARVWSRGRLHAMPRSLMGVPIDAKSLSDSRLLSRGGVARATLDQVRPATDIGDTDVSVGWLIEQRFGPEVLDRLVEPLLGGVYAGHARELSLRATMPQVAALMGQDKSLMRAAAGSLARRPTQDDPVFAGLAGGVGQLAAAVADGLDVRTGTTVRRLERTEDGWQVVVGPTTAEEVIRADAVVLALPAAPAARLLEDAVPAAARELAGIEYASMAVLTFAFRARDFPQVEGSGFLVPPVEGRRVKAATFSFLKWDWVREASEELVVMRTSIGRHREEHDLQRDDADLVTAATEDLAQAIGLSVRPVEAVVTRWGGGLPQYAVGHLDRVHRIRHAVAAAGGLAVCGAAYDGVGIPACIGSGRLAAEAVLAGLERLGE